MLKYPISIIFKDYSQCFLITRSRCNLLFKRSLQRRQYILVCFFFCRKGGDLHCILIGAACGDVHGDCIGQVGVFAVRKADRGLAVKGQLRKIRAVGKGVRAYLSDRIVDNDLFNKGVELERLCGDRATAGEGQHAVLVDAPIQAVKAATLRIRVKLSSIGHVACYSANLGRPALEGVDIVAVLVLLGSSAVVLGHCTLSNVLVGLENVVAVLPCDGVGLGIERVIYISCLIINRNLCSIVTRFFARRFGAKKCFSIILKLIVLNKYMGIILCIVIFPCVTDSVTGCCIKCCNAINPSSISILIQYLNGFRIIILNKDCQCCRYRNFDGYRVFTCLTCPVQIASSCSGACRSNCSMIFRQCICKGMRMVFVGQIARVGQAAVNVSA